MTIKRRDADQDLQDRLAKVAEALRNMSHDEIDAVLRHAKLSVSCKSTAEFVERMEQAIEANARTGKH